VTKPSWLTVALAGAGGFFAGVLLVAILGGPKGTVRTTTVERTATVTRTVDGRNEVPDVVGQTVAEAKDALTDAGFDANVEANSLFGVIDEDNWVVVTQDPGAGERLAAGAPVTVTAERD